MLGFILEAIPEEWYEGDRDGLHRLVEALLHRRVVIRKLICEFSKSSRNPFPKWLCIASGFCHARRGTSSIA